MTTLTVVIPTIGRQSLDRACRLAAMCANQVLVIADNAPDVDADLHVNFGCPGSTRNAAMPLVTSRWVAFCDDDDVLVPDTYRKALAEHNDADMVIHTMWHPQLGPIPRPGYLINHGNVGISFMLRTSIWVDNPFIAGPPLTFAGEDYELVQRMIDQSRNVVTTGEVGYLVRPQENQS